VSASERAAPRPDQTRGLPERCSTCGSGLVTPIFCFNCDHLQPFVAVPDYFRLFGLPRAYEIEKAALEAAYQRLSFALHPDLLTGAAPGEKRKSERLAADVNEGYRVLNSETQRGAYLLDLLAGGAKLDTRQLPAGFLHEMFVLQEQVDELGDDAPEESRRPLRETVENRLREALTDRARLFREALAGHDHADHTTLQAIQSNLNEETYLRRLMERLAAPASR
jgi:molecular chaperone HscB